MVCVWHKLGEGVGVYVVEGKGGLFQYGLEVKSGPTEVRILQSVPLRTPVFLEYVTPAESILIT